MKIINPNQSTYSSEFSSMGKLTFAHFGIVPIPSIRTIIGRSALVTVNAFRVVLTILADATTLIVAMQIQR